MSLAAAIAQLEAEVLDFGQGTARQPKEGTADWFLLRAKSMGLSSLKRAQQLRLDSPASAERYFRASSRLLKHEVEVGSEPG